MHQTTRPSSDLKARLLAGSLWAFVATWASPALAEAPGKVDVPAGSLEAALTTLAGQTHQQVLYKADLVANRRAPGVKGLLTSDEALRRLLQGTGLSAKRTGPNVLVLHLVPGASGEVGDRPFAAEGAPDLIASARDGVTPAPAAAPALLDEVTVTGSFLRGAPRASSLLVVDRSDLARSGRETVAEALRALPENFTGGAGETSPLLGADTVGRNTSYGSGLNLRGLGNGATLVLLNGRRLAGSGTFGDYADVSSIPSAIVDRVEILLDGASATYGSDAVGGVVNIITRKDYEGAEVRLQAGVGAGGEPVDGQASLLFGKRWGAGGVVVSYELQRRERLATDDRDVAATSDLRAFGGADFRSTTAFPGNVLATAPGGGTLTPTYGIPAGQNGIGLKPSDFLLGTLNRQRQRIGVDLLPRQTLNSVYVAFDQDLGDRLEITSDARFGVRRFKARQGIPTSTLTVGRNNPFFVSPNGAATNQIAYSFAGQLPNVVSSGQVESLGLTAGAKLKLFGDWRSEAYATFAQEITEQRGGGFVNSLVLNEALGNAPDNPATPFSVKQLGFLNPYAGVLGVNSPALLASIASGSTFARIRSRVASVTAQADGSLWTLPGGDVKLAVGLQARRETLLRSGYNFIASVAPVATSPTDVSRDVTAAFAELSVPLVGEANARPGLHELQFSLAGRVEHYEAVATTANPKIGVVWSPVSDVLVRATYSRSFRAPALRELYDPASYDPTLVVLGADRIRTLSLSGGNPDLRPQTARSWTGGIEVRPSAIPGLSLSVSAFDIRFKNRIDRPVSGSLSSALVDPTVATFVRRLAPTANPADLAFITALLDSAPNPEGRAFLPAEYGAVVDSRYVNTATLSVRGVDAFGAYAFDVGGNQVRLGANATWLLDYKQQLTPTGAVVERVNVANFPLAFRGRLTADWTRGRFTLGGAVNYTGRYRDAAGERIDDLATIDLQARLAPAKSGPLAGVAVLLNVRNAFNTDPPFYNNPLGVAYDATNGDPVGRYISLQLTRSW